MLCTVGDLVTDVVVKLSGPPVRGTDTPAQIMQTQGGSAANVALSAIRAELPCRFVGRVGEDDRGLSLIRVLEDAGVDVVAQRHGITGSIVVLVDADGERSFLTDRGAATELTIDPELVLDGVSWVHLPGYSFGGGAIAESCQLLVAEAKDRGIPVSVTTASESFLRDFGREEFLQLIDVIAPKAVFANTPEAAFALAGGSHFPNTEWSVITAGGGATTITHRTGDHRSIRPPDVEVVDSTGAGDSFAGAFIASMLRNETPLQAVEAGHASSASTLLRLGAGSGHPATKEL